MSWHERTETGLLFVNIISPQASEKETIVSVLPTFKTAEADAAGGSHPLISIALCTYNGARFLREQLDSLIAQDYSPLEIIVVDDGSTDGTLKILDEYRRRDTRISVYCNPVNLGFRKNFERAIHLCKGELIATCDQDDIWLPDKLTILEAALGNGMLAYCDSELIDATGRNLNMRASDKLNMYAGSDPKVFAFHNCISGHAMLFRRGLLLHAEPFPDCGYHDWWLAFVAACVGTITYVDKPLVKYRQHPAAQTNMARLQSPLRKPKTAIDSLNEMSCWLRAISRYTPCPQHEFFETLYNAWTSRFNRFVTPDLYSIMFRHRNSFFFIRKDTSYRRWRRALRFFWGLRAKRLFKPGKYPRHSAIAD